MIMLTTAPPCSDPLAGCPARYTRSCNIVGGDGSAQQAVRSLHACTLQDQPPAAAIRVSDTVASSCLPAE